MLSWDEPVEIVEAEVMAPVPRKQIMALASQRRVRELREAVMSKATMVVGAQIGAAEIDPENPKVIPAGWIEEYGAREAKERHRIAMYALANSADAPVFLKTATSVMQGIMKIEAAEKQGPRVMNVAIVQMPAANLDMEEIIVRGE